MSETQRKIGEVCDNLAGFLQKKNELYMFRLLSPLYENLKKKCPYLWGEV